MSEECRGMFRGNDMSRGNVLNPIWAG